MPAGMHDGMSSSSGKQIETQVLIMVSLTEL